MFEWEGVHLSKNFLNVVLKIIVCYLDCVILPRGDAY